MSNYDGAKKRVEVNKVIRSIKNGSTWYGVAIEYGFDSAEKIRKFVKDRCNSSVFREVDKKAKKNE